jgi:hypothetical protein
MLSSGTVLSVPIKMPTGRMVALLLAVDLSNVGPPD